jgi:Kef-type K+ transport system membrane component KefB
MLARIIVERGLAGTRLGTLALGAGACDDLAAWTVLAVLVAVFSAQPMVAVLAVGGGALYVLAAWLGVRPLARRLVERAGPAALGGQGLIAALLALALSCWLTEAIRLYAVFGSFVLGMCMPRGDFSRRLSEKIEPLTTALLVPVFFAYTGLNTRIGLLDTPALWLVTLAVLAASCLAKGGACGLAARFSGYSWADAAAVGALMNARGLMELILLDIAYQRKLITQTTFTIYVLMAVITTLAASPLFDLVRPWLHEEEARAPRRAPVEA